MQASRIHVAALAACVLLCGCATGRGGPETTIVGGDGVPETELDSGQTLARELEIRKVASADRGGFRVVEFELHNERGSQVALEWSVEWKDASGLTVQTRESWHPLVIGGRGYESLQITAPTPEARTWTLKVRKPNPVR